MHEYRVQVGPAAFRIGSTWQMPLDHLARLYDGYPTPGIADFTVRLEPPSVTRRFARRSVAITGDFMLPDAIPLPYAHALLAAEMGMNLQMALGWRRHLLLHAGAAEKDGRAVILTGLSGSGKSTLSALLAERGWRFLGDEFVLIDLVDGTLAPFPRPVSLKNEAIPFMSDICAASRFGPTLSGTPKGTVRHLAPHRRDIDAMARPATPALILFPQFGAPFELREVPRGETFARLTQASTNYVALGEAGFAALSRLVAEVPALALDYPDGESAFCEIDRIWKTMTKERTG